MQVNNTKSTKWYSDKDFLFDRYHQLYSINGYNTVFFLSFLFHHIWHLTTRCYWSEIRDWRTWSSTWNVQKPREFITTIFSPQSRYSSACGCISWCFQTSSRQREIKQTGSSKDLSVNPVKTQWGLVDSAINVSALFCNLHRNSSLQIFLQLYLYWKLGAHSREVTFAQNLRFADTIWRLFTHCLHTVHEKRNVYWLPGKYDVSGVVAWDLTEICSYFLSQKGWKKLHKPNVAVDIQSWMHSNMCGPLLF